MGLSQEAVRDEAWFNDFNSTPLPQGNNRGSPYLFATRNAAGDWSKAQYATGRQGPPGGGKGDGTFTGRRLRHNIGRLVELSFPDQHRELAMHKVDRYLLKNAFFIFLLANIIAYVPREMNLFPWLNAIAVGLCLVMFFLIRLTVRRYAEEFGKTRKQVKDLLGTYIEDDKRGKVSFNDYLKKRQAGSVAVGDDLQGSN